MPTSRAQSGGLCLGKPQRLPTHCPCSQEPLCCEQCGQGTANAAPMSRFPGRELEREPEGMLAWKPWGRRGLESQTWVLLCEVLISGAAVSDWRRVVLLCPQ